MVLKILITIILLIIGGVAYSLISLDETTAEEIKVPCVVDGMTFENATCTKTLYDCDVIQKIFIDSQRCKNG